ncbi:mammalian cell entry protein [Mycolicibacter minnesotensis]|uniref:Mammalian cell entry protein n=1 Tax=Mycolicibacter minnesotensis TaxID=1118379 RepID=A0A7I7R5A0_9MYCO|nr:MCE family protein [Mycolicibacter minnesotensis]ORA97959.1 mammalian cell entry protein [Mycolicibacter minnesotensis]BBY33818.1 mammalian cell entry protein [Mycolicibacter minnesotensis]
MTPRRRRVAQSLAALLCSAVVASSVAGCGTSGLDALPLPAPGIGSGGYLLTAVFANALNLPGHAKVKLSGADVGQMESMVARNYTAVTTLRIMDGVRIPLGSTAELRSATPLGDVFVAIKLPTQVDPSAPLLKGGDTIGLDSTASAATVESVLSSAALLVNGGAVQNFTNLVNGAGKATGDQGKAFGKLLGQSNDLLAKLNARSTEIESALRETSRLADALDSRSAALTDVLNAAGPATDTLADNTSQIADLVEQLGATSRQLSRFPSIAGTDDSGHSFIKDANVLAGAWNDVATDPNTSLYALNRLMAPFIKMMPNGGASVHASIDRLVWGSMPDAGFKGDPAFHGPKRYDWAKLAGSIKFTLWRLQERVVGRGPDSDMGQAPWMAVGPPIPPTPAEIEAAAGEPGPPGQGPTP